MLLIENILDRIKFIEEVESDYKVSKILNVSTSHIANWRKRKTIPYGVLYDYSVDKSLLFGWLLTGDGDIYLKLQRGSALDEEAAKLRNEISAELSALPKKDYRLALRIIKGLKDV